MLGQGKAHGMSTRTGDWDISRDAPYFGSRSREPGNSSTSGSSADRRHGSLKNWCAIRPRLRRDLGDSEIHISSQGHIISTGCSGRRCSGLAVRVPAKLHVNGYLTVNAKMSKSRGTVIRARTYLQSLNPEYWLLLRGKLSEGTDDLDLDLQGLQGKIDSDLVAV